MSSAKRLQCDGWWEQDGFGRQPMKQLEIEFQDGQLRGTGIDMVGPFGLQGSIAEDGSASILKRYLGQHDVVYLGRYDGEGVLSGEWDIYGVRGKWMIRLSKLAGGEAAIREYAPIPPPE